MKLSSLIAPSGDMFRATEAANRALLEQVQEAARAAEKGGGPRARERHVSRGKMLPRDRVAAVLDPGAPFLEIGATAAHGL